MHLTKRTITRPTCLLLLIASFCVTASTIEIPQFAHDSSAAQSRDGRQLQKEELTQHDRPQARPIGLRKMSDDPGEKFFFDYWTWEDGDQCGNLASWTNQSYSIFMAPVGLHAESGSVNTSLIARFFERSLTERSTLNKRDYRCPTNTFACTSISRPDSCCENGSTCEIITDTGLGDVGCCQKGEKCAGQLTSCASGYTPCPKQSGGGCCIPGYACHDIGCVSTATTVVLTTPTTSPTPVPDYTATVTSTIVVSVFPSGSTSTVTPTSSPTSAAETTPVHTSALPLVTTTVYITVTVHPTTTRRPNILTCSPGSRSCPASLGGGCCPTGSDCGSGVCPPKTSTATFRPPVRGTTASTATTTLHSSGSGPGCPTGFYACSAYYGGGCCRTGRDCQSTSCPAQASTTLISTNGVTIVAPAVSGVSKNTHLLTGSCANGWSACAATHGGGCCPSGYVCGVSCTGKGPQGTGNQVGKMPLNSAVGRAHSMVVLYMTLCIALACCLVAMLF